MVIAGTATIFAAEPSVQAEQLPRVPPTAPESAISTFRLRPGFRIELVAAEPLVVDPIAISFDEDGRCYVVEMRDYSERRPERLGRIRLLEDIDGDGRFDKSVVFAQDLPWPTAVICWNGGVFVGATPDIIYFKDTDRDGVADIQESIFTGFASDYAPFATNKLNVQALMNSFNWSLDNRIHGATSFSGGKVKLIDSSFVREWLRRVEASPSPGAVGEASAKDKDFSVRGEGGRKASRSTDLGSSIDLRGRDFSFDPRTLEMRAESGGGQHGLSFDNRGRKFVCSNSSHIQTLMYEERYAGRNPFYSMPRALVEIAADGGAAPVFRISPDEPWRVIRTQWRVSGLVSGPIEGGGRPSGYFTGATGITIYRGDAYGPEFVGDAFVGDAGGNLVHRKKIFPDGVGVKAIRPADEQNVEFLASTDNWFRPVQMANAPDGCLYICDMYREVIEHPWSLPDSLKKHLDLNSGNDRGRLYRVVPEKFKQRPLPRLSKANSTELVALLAHANGWHRDTAARLLLERGSYSATHILSNLLVTTTEPNSKVCILHVLAGLNALAETQLIRAVHDPHPAVLENALKLAEPSRAQSSDKISNEVVRRVKAGYSNRGEPSVALQLCLSLGTIRHPNRLNVLSDSLIQLADFLGRTNRLPQNDGVVWIEAAVLNGVGDDAVQMLERATGETLFFGPDFHDSFVTKLARQIGARNRSEEIAATTAFAARHLQSVPDVIDNTRLRTSWKIISGLAEGLQQAGHSGNAAIARPRLERLFGFALWFSGDPEQSDRDRQAAIEVLGTANYPDIKSNLFSLVTQGGSSATIRHAALVSLFRLGNPDLGTDLLGQWPRLTPALRTEVVAALLRRREWVQSLLAALEEGLLVPSNLSAAQQIVLRTHRDPAIRERAEKALGRRSVATRQSVVDAFEPSLALTGVAKSGLATFQARCATCHKLGKEGHDLGPDLVTVKNAGKEKLLTNILDPNREVNANYVSFLIETRDGESLSGLIVNESSANVTVRMAGGVESIVARANIATLQSQGKSLMPEGLEEGLSQQDMADLLEFIVATP